MTASIERSAKMLKAHLAGKSTTQIAAQFAVTRQAVRARLKAMGVEFEEDDRHSLWTMPDDRRRVAIAERAARAAREQLNAIS